MLCQICKTNKATIHFTQMFDKNYKDVYLCEKCAKKIDATKILPIDFNLILSALKNIKLPEFFNEKNAVIVPIVTCVQNKEKSEKKRACLNCKSTWEQISINHEFGCKNCYKYFDKDLIKYYNEHKIKIGRNGTPPMNFRDLDLELKKEELEFKLCAAIETEQYELCAKLRDEINYIKNKIIENV